MKLQELFLDPPKRPVSPAISSLMIESHDERLLGVCYSPGGEIGQRHPLALFLHGFPGTEQNLDIMQSLRQMGMVTATFHYRGSWGSGGDYALSHLPEDSAAVLAYLQENAAQYHADPDRIYLIGHSMGGFAAIQLLASQKKVRGAVLIAPCDVAYQYEAHHDGFFATLQPSAEESLHVRCRDIFETECAGNPQWRFPSAAQKIDPSLPILFLGAKQDETVPPQENIDEAYAVLKKRGCPVKYITLDADHCFNNRRIELTRTIAQWIIERENEPLSGG